LEEYRKWIPDMRERQPRAKDRGRYLAFEHEATCRATMDELRMCLPDGLPLVMQIDSWHHREYMLYENGPERRIIGDKPSSYETFPLIADVLVTGDPSRFRPTLAPNNHWSHWPEAGSL
jgi:hypothetical protein